MKSFNAAAARAKRPCPLWVDAFYRDTQHLQTDEIGAYLLILMAMWSREACDIQDDDARLAKVCRVSLRLWKARIGPVLRPYFQAANGVLLSKRLREEAAYVERQVTHQSDRKVGKKHDNHLKNNAMGKSADYTADQSAENPSQQPNNPTVEEGGGGSAQAREQSPQDQYDEILRAAGVDVSKDISGKWYGSEQQGWVAQWRGGALRLSQQEILTVVSETKPSHGPPGTLKYFNGAMQRFAGLRDMPPLAPVIPLETGPSDARRPSRQSRGDATLDAFLSGARG